MHAITLILIVLTTITSVRLEDEEERKVWELTYQDQQKNCDLTFINHPLGKQILEARKPNLESNLANRVTRKETAEHKIERYELGIGCGINDGIDCFPLPSSTEEKALILRNLHVIHRSRESIRNPTSSGKM